MATDTEIEEVLSDLADAYPDWKPGNVTLTFNQYKNSLRVHGADDIRRAARRCMDTCTFFPKIAELLQAIYKIRENETDKKMSSWDNLKFVPCPPEIQEQMDKLMGRWRVEGKMVEGRKSREYQDSDFFSLDHIGKQTKEKQLPPDHAEMFDHHLPDVEARLPYKDSD